MLTVGFKLFTHRFSIDTSSGEIKTATALDRETSERHSIRVLARDKELPSRETEVSVMIDVVDINDHRPAFSQRHYIVAVREQQPAHVIMNLTVGVVISREGWFGKVMSYFT